MASKYVASVVFGMSLALFFIVALFTFQMPGGLPVWHHALGIFALFVSIGSMGYSLHVITD